MFILYLPDDEWINFDHIRIFQLEKAAYLLAAWIKVIESLDIQNA